MRKPHRRKRQLRLRVYSSELGSMPAIRAGDLLLEYFSDDQLIYWRSRGKDIQDYHYLWFFELESQRATNQARITEALASTQGLEVDLAGWGRALPYKYSDIPLSWLGSMKWVGGRFNYGGDIDVSRFAPFPALYLAEDFETGLREMHGLQRGNSRAGLTAEEMDLCGASSVSWVRVEGAVRNVFDLTRVSNLRAIADVFTSFKISRNVREAEERLKSTPLRLVKTPRQLQQSFMLENWREFPAFFSTPSNSQLFGHLLCHAGFNGVLYPSATTKARNLAVFPRQIRNSNSRVEAIEPPSTARCTVLSAETYEAFDRSVQAAADESHGLRNH